MPAAHRYAKALFQLVREQGTLEETGTAIATLQQVVADPDISRTLENPALGPVRRHEFAALLAKGVNAPAELSAALDLLARNNRLPVLPRMLRAFRALQDTALGHVRVRVQTAEPLTGRQRERLGTVLQEYTDSKGVEIEETHQPELIAGFRAFFAGKVWDTSLLGRLSRFEMSLHKGLHAHTTDHADHLKGVKQDD